MATTTSAPRQRLSLTAEAAAQLQAQQTDDDQRVRVPPGSIEVGGAGVLGGLAGLPLAFVLDLALSDDHVCACSCSCSCSSPSLPPAIDKCVVRQNDVGQASDVSCTITRVSSASRASRTSMFSSGSSSSLLGGSGSPASPQVSRAASGVAISHPRQGTYIAKSTLQAAGEYRVAVAVKNIAKTFSISVAPSM